MNCLIQIRDNGSGIDVQYQQTIFEEFFQISNPQRDRSQGLGLGLAIVKRLAGLLDHPINLHSCPGVGSTFALLVPLNTDDEYLDNNLHFDIVNKIPISKSVAGDLSRGRILLVEDDAMVRLSYERLLKLWGCDVYAHGDAESALRQLLEYKLVPQTIIADYRLGSGLNGLELIRTVRAQTSQHIPAALITGNTEDLELRHLNEVNTRVLFKPVNPALLRQTLSDFFNVNVQST